MSACACVHCVAFKLTWYTGNGYTLVQQLAPESPHASTLHLQVSLLLPLCVSLPLLLYVSLPV